MWNHLVSLKLILYISFTSILKKLKGHYTQTLTCILSSSFYRMCIWGLEIFTDLYKFTLDEAQAGIKIARRNRNQNCWKKYQSSQIHRWHHPYGRKWRGTKEALDESVQESEKAGLKLNSRKTKIMASGPITSCQIDRETTKTVTNFIFLGSKITVDGGCSLEMKRHLLLGRKAMIKLKAY